MAMLSLSKKAWSPENCPVNVGSVLFWPLINADLLVTKRYRDNSKKVLLTAGGFTFTGEELLVNEIVYYPHWPDTNVIKGCYNEIKENTNGSIKI